ncbi:MAG: hypothetical protein ABFS34_04970 [Gemmatimonadota bacterium]
MNWEAIGAIGESLGAVAVVISLAYLAVQIRTQNDESRRAAMHEISVGFRESICTFTDARMADLFTRTNRGDDSLTDAETLQLIVGIQRVFRVWEEAHGHYVHGRLAPDIWEAMLRQYASYLAAPGFQMVWRLRKNFYNEAFRTFVDELPRTEYTIR